MIQTVTRGFSVLRRKFTQLPVTIYQVKHSQMRSFTGGAKLVSGKANIKSVRFAKRFCYAASILTYLGLAKEEGTSISKEGKARELIVDNIKRAILAQQKGDPNLAEQLLHLALKTAQEHIDSQAETYIFDIMANFALDNGDRTKAEKLFKSVAQRLVNNEGMSADNNAVLEISLKLASIYSASGKLAEAESGYLYCLQQLDKKVKSECDEDTIMLFAWCADTYGRHLMTIGRYSEAREQFLKAFEASKTVQSGLNQTLIVINNLASACSMIGRYEEAAEYLQGAISITKANSGELQDDNISAYYRNLGAVYIQMGNYFDAEKMCRKALNTSHEEFRREAMECLNDLRKKQT